jgi:hypothetical protein
LTLAPIPGPLADKLPSPVESLRCIADQGKGKSPSHSLHLTTRVYQSRIYTCLPRAIHSPPSSPHTPHRKPDSASYYYLSMGHFHNLLSFNGYTLHISSLHSHIQPNARIYHLTDRLSFLILPFVPSSERTIKYMKHSPRPSYCRAT